MKSIIILISLLFINSTSFSKISDSKRAKIISELKKGNYKVLDFYYSRKKAKPFITLQNGQIYVKQFYTKDPITKPFTFKNNGKPFLYKNSYGVLFVNDKEVLLSLDEIKSMPNSECFGFYQMMQKAYSATNHKQIQQLYQEFVGIDLSYYYTIVQDHYNAVFINFDYHLGIDEKEVFTKQEREDIAEGFFNLVYPTEKQKITAYLNMILSKVLRDYYDGHPYLTVPSHYMKVKPYLSDKTQEYRCFNEPPQKLDFLKRFSNENK